MASWMDAYRREGKSVRGMLSKRQARNVFAFNGDDAMLVLARRSVARDAWMVTFIMGDGCRQREIESPFRASAMASVVESKLQEQNPNAVVLIALDGADDSAHAHDNNGRPIRPVM